MGKWTAKEKARIVLEVLTGQRTVTDACRTYGVSESVYYRWQRKFLDDAHLVFGSTCKEQEARIHELERLVGQMALELEVLKKASSIYRQRKGGAW